MVQRRRLGHEALELMGTLNGEDGSDLVWIGLGVGSFGECDPGIPEGQPGSLGLLNAIEVYGAVR